MPPTSRIIASLLGLVVAPVTLAGETVVSFDAFEDGGVAIFSNNDFLGSESPSSAIGGHRAFSFVNFSGTGTLTLDDTEQSLGLVSDGLGQTTIGYGYRLSDPPNGGLVGTTLTAMDADLSSYEILRFHVVENNVAHRPVGFEITFFTFLGPQGVAMSTADTDTPDGFIGAFEVPMTDIVGEADIADVDYILITVRSRFVDQDWKIGPIELVDTDAPLICAGDCDDSGTVDFNDLIAMLFVFDTDTGDGCDADGSGNVDFNDLISALFAFGGCP